MKSPHKKNKTSKDLRSVSKKDSAVTSSSLEESSQEIKAPIISGRTIQYFASIAFFILVIVSSIGIFLLSNRI